MRRLNLTTALIALVSAACSNEPTAARVGTIRVSVQTSGSDVDTDGYQLIVGGTNFRRPLGAQETVDVRTVAVGTHTVTLENVAANCTVTGDVARSVTVENGRTTDITFEIVCVRTGIVVTTRTTGVDNPDTYSVVVDDRPASSVGANGSTTVTRLAPGSYSIALVIPGTHCTVAGGARATVDVVAGTLTPVTFDVSCVAPTRPEMIAFAVDTLIDGKRQKWIGTMNPDGTSGVLYAPGNSPAWSADRTKIVFSDASCHEVEYDGVDISCEGRLEIVDPETHNASTIEETFGGFDPAWSPSNDAMAYLSCCDTANEPGNLLLLPLDRPGARPLVIADVATIRDPAWSPDGQRLVFACVVAETFSPPDANWDICIANRNGTDFFRLTSDASRDTHPAWSPDGRRIAFTRDQGIAVITFGEPGLTRLTTGGDPAWSPDGTRLVFVDSGGLFTIGADGTNRQRLAAGSYSSPAWRP